MLIKLITEQWQSNDFLFLKFKIHYYKDNIVKLKFRIYTKSPLSDNQLFTEKRDIVQYCA